MAQIQGTRRWFLGDTQGSIIAETDSSGARVGSAITYDPYGQPGSWIGPRFGYTGQMRLTNALPLWHYKARVYYPNIGRFLQTDPIGYQDSLNLYQYVGNDPVNGVDPTGMKLFDGWGDFEIGDGHIFDDTPAPGATTGPPQDAGAAAAMGRVTATSPVAGAAAAADGPIPVGDIIALGMLACAALGPEQCLQAAINAIPGARAVAVVVTVADTLHGNSHRSQRPTELYFLLDRDTSEIQKIGITSPGSGPRYSDTYLRQENVYYRRQYQFSSRYPAIVAENVALVPYNALYGELPRLNRRFY